MLAHLVAPFSALRPSLLAVWLLAGGLGGWLSGPGHAPAQAYQQALQAGKPDQALQAYRKARPFVDETGTEASARLGQLNRLADSVARANLHYRNAARNGGPWGSLANNNLAVLTQWGQTGLSDSALRLDQALKLLKQALLADPDNDTARYNYELLRRQLPPPPPPNPNPPPPPPPSGAGRPGQTPRQRPHAYEALGDAAPPPTRSPAESEAYLRSLKERETQYLYQTRKHLKGYAPGDAPTW